jgi:hypothetical protein
VFGLLILIVERIEMDYLLELDKSVVLVLVVAVVMLLVRVLVVPLELLDDE